MDSGKTATEYRTRQTPGEPLPGHPDLASAINSTPFMVTRCSRDLRYLFASEAYARMLGRRPEEVIGSKVLDVMGEKGFATIFPSIERVLRGERVEYEAEVHFKGIGSRLLHIVYTPDTDERGVVQGWTGSIRDVTDQRRAEHRVAADLRAMSLLREVGTLCVREGENGEKCLHEILDAAIAITNADKGNIQILEPTTAALRIAAQRGFDEPFLKFFEAVRDEDSACGVAMRSCARMIVEDVTTSDIFAGKPALDVLIGAGVRAVQSTPLVSSTGRLLGMISTHFAHPTELSEGDLGLIDLLARQAADYLERRQSEEAEKQTKEALRQSELRWRTMTEALPNLVWTDLPDGQCDWLSTQWGAYTGIPEQELLGLNWLDRVIHPDDRERTLAAWHAACADEADYDIEYRIRRHDGEYRWFKTRGVPIRDEYGRIIYWFGTCTDVEDLRQAEAARAQLAAIVESSADAIYTYSFDGTLLTWNKSAERLYGYSAEEVVGRGMDLIVPPEKKAEAESKIISAAKEGRPVSGLATLRMRRDGTLFNALLTASPIFDVAGKPAAVSIIVRNVTDQNLTEEKLRESEATFRAMFSISSVGKFQADPETGRFLRVNAAMCELTGYSEPELLQRRFADITHSEDWPRDGEALRRLVRGEADKFDAETRYVRKDGSLVWVRATLNLITTADGRPLRTTAIIQDITDRKRAEEQAELLLREVNHRAKNMLALVQAIARQTASGDPKEFIAHFGERVQALAASQDLLVKSGWKDIPIDELVRAQLAHFHDLLDERIRLRGPKLNLTAAAAQTIGMALHELATNASKYGALSSAPGIVDIEWSAEQGRFSMSWVEKDGPPVSQPCRSGFGSTVLQRLAKMNFSADVRLDFAETGANWHLDCPLDQVLERGARITSKASASIAQPKGKRARILIVEDEPLPAIEMATELMDAGFDVIGPAASVAQAISLLGQGFGCDGAVLDINLGRETSEPIARLLRSSGVPFVTVSGYAREQLPPGFGTPVFLAKPLRPRVLVETVKALSQKAREDPNPVRSLTVLP